MTEITGVEEKRKLDWAPGWSSASQVLGLSLLVLAVVFSSTYADIVYIWWRAETYTHGFLILPIVGYLLWQKRVDLASLPPRPASKAVLVMALPTLLWLAGYAAQVAVVEQFAVVSMLPILVWTIFGNTIAKRILFPLAYLFFAVPVGDFLVPPLQDITAAFTVWALKLTGIPVYWEGRFFHIPSGSFEVAVACSGIRYLIASMALGTLYAYLNYTSLKRRLIFIIMAAIVPIIANGVRAYGIVMLAHLSDYTLAVGVDHIIYGWVFFGVVIMALFWGGSFFHEESPSDLSSRRRPDYMDAEGRATHGAVAEGSRDSNGGLDSGLRRNDEIRVFALWATLVIAVAISGPGFAAWMDARSAAIPTTDVELPLGNGGWSGPLEMDNEWRPSFVGAQEIRAEYRKNGKSVQVYLAYYPSQKKDAELINIFNTVYDDKHSRRLGGGTTQAQLSPEKNWPVLTTRLESGGRSRLVWHWYEIDSSATVSRVWAKAYAVRSRLLGSSVGSAAWVISSEYSISAKESAIVMQDFLSEMLPQLRETVAQ